MFLRSFVWTGFLLSNCAAYTREIERPPVAAQPLAANAGRLISAYEYLGAPLPAPLLLELQISIALEDSRGIQELLDQRVLYAVSINPELRVKVQRGPAAATLQQAGYTPLLVKVLNAATVTRRIQVHSPQAGPSYSGAAEAILKRQAQTELNKNENLQNQRRFLEVEMFDQSPMTPELSGLEVEYALAMVYSSEAGQREATIVFDIGQGTQDLGFRSEVPVLFTVRPAVPVTLRITDHDGRPTTARLEFRDKHGHVYPPQARRIAPDLIRLEGLPENCTGS